MNPTTCQSCGAPMGQVGPTLWACSRCWCIATEVMWPETVLRVRWQVSQDGGKTWTDCKVGK